MLVTITNLKVSNNCLKVTEHSIHTELKGPHTESMLYFYTKNFDNILSNENSQFEKKKN